MKRTLQRREGYRESGKERVPSLCRFGALVLHPWVTSRGGPAGKGWTEPAEVEHGEGDEGVG